MSHSGHTPFKIGDLVRVREAFDSTAIELGLPRYISVVPVDAQRGDAWVTSKEVDRGDVGMIVDLERWGNGKWDVDVTVLFSDGTVAKTWINDWERA